jgi:mono/diheme cytochrome c family protein
MLRSLGAAAMLVALTAPSAFAQDQAEIAAGSEVYQTNCSACHGERLISPGGIPDLRGLSAGDRSRFETTVTEGKGQMPAWGGMLSDQQIGQIWAYIRSRAGN